MDLLQNFPTEQVRVTFVDMLEDWTNACFDPYAAPQETGMPYGRKNGNNNAAVRRVRQLAERCVGLKDDLGMRTDNTGYPINRAFADVPQDAPELHPEPGFEKSSARVQPVCVSFAFRRGLESFIYFGRQA
ncbi:hypothetical protein ACFS07_33595 [Undibacterium arcticum]